MRPLLLALLLAVSPAVHAGDFTAIANLTQSEFRRLSGDLGAAAAYKGVTPATPLGLVGFEVGVELASTRIEHPDLFGIAGAGRQSGLTIPKLHGYKGLPGALDLGAFVSGVPDLAGNLFGADLRWAIYDDTLATPAVALRLSGTMSHGLAVEIATVGLDAMVSKKLALVTPYAGAGLVRVRSKAPGSALAEEAFHQGRAFVGLNVNLVLANLAIEAEKMGDNTTLSARLGWRF